MNKWDVTPGPKNYEFDLVQGDYVICEVETVKDYNKPKRHRSVVRVETVYPGITECTRANGAHWCLQNNEYVCGLARKATAEEVRKYFRK